MDQGIRHQEVIVEPLNFPDNLPGAQTNESIETYTYGGENGAQGSGYFSRSSGLESVVMGEKSVVEDRFYALLKRRLQVEIAANPPLFPWETEILDYVEVEAWAPQLQALNLPVALPEAVLTPLFQRCQAVVQTVHKQGLQLVEAVETLFPDDREQLNHFANTMLLGAARDQERGRNWLFGSDVPATYDQASPSQQMLLTLMAAQDLLNQATLGLSPQQPRVLRQWQTAMGTLEVTATYTEPLPGQIKLDIWADLPDSGELSLTAGETLTAVKRDGPGNVNLVIPNAQMHGIYPLNIQVQGGGDPLKFVVRLSPDV